MTRAVNAAKRAVKITPHALHSHSARAPARAGTTSAGAALAPAALATRVQPERHEGVCLQIEALRTPPAWRTLPTGHILPTTYRCRYVADALDEEASLLLPPDAAAERASECKKAECLLFANALSIALEFGLLFLIAAYACTYAVADARWVLEHDHADEQRDTLLPPSGGPRGQLGALIVPTAPATSHRAAEVQPGLGTGVLAARGRGEPIAHKSGPWLTAGLNVDRA